MKWRLYLCLLALSVLSGCYTAIQRTTYVATTEPFDEEDGMPATDMSISSDLYELALGVSIWRADIFTGLGVGPQRVRQRRPGSATEPDELSSGTRYFFGTAVTAFQTENFRLRPYGLYAVDFTLLGDEFEAEIGILDSRITKHVEGGIEIDLDMVSGEDSKIGTGSIFLRFGYASVEGKTSPDFFGSETFDGSALLATFGFALSHFEWF